MTKARGPFICMVVYTDYAFDARVRREAETLAANGFHVRCLCLRTNRQTGSEFVLDGVHVRELRISKYRGKSRLSYIASYLQFLVQSAIACLGLLLKSELTAVHVHNLPDFLVGAAVIPRLAGCKVVLDIHDSVPETFATKFSGSSALWKALCAEERLSALVAHRVICVNEPQRHVVVARGIPQDKTFVSMNVPDPAIFSPPEGHRDAPRQDGILNLVYHGTMANRLGVDLVIRAVAQLRGGTGCIRLHLWGSGDDLVSYQHLADELGVADQVLFRPSGYPLRDLPEHLQAMDLGVVGNRRNVATELMLPVKLLEYVALDIPVVAPRLKTIEHYFSDDMVSYFDADDVDSLAGAIARMGSDPAARLAQAARARTFLSAYGWQRQGMELVDFYRSLVEQRTS